MAGKTFGARPIVLVGGKPIPEQVQALVRSVVVETDAGGPDSCRIVLDDPAREVLASSGIDLHAELSVSAGRTGEQTGVEVFTGLVYHLGFEYDDRGAFSTVVAYDRSYDLYNGRHTATYQNVTDSDLATKLAQQVGLRTGQVEATSVVHDHVSQVNETHWEFLTRRAREIDYTLRVTGSQLDFSRSTEADEAPEPGDFESVERLALVPGGNLEQLSARVTAAQQVTEVEVRGWDVKNKRAIVATAPARSRGAKLKDSADAVAGKFGSARHVTVDLPLSSQAECDAVAGAQAERLAGTCVYAEGVAQGDPRIVSGAAVSLGQTGGRFDGKVTVSRARHTWDVGGYRTSFSVSGVHDRSVRGLVTGDAGRSGPQRIGGVVLGIVTNASDPEARGRVKLRFPWLSEEYESDWARVVQIGAGDKRGLHLLPEVNDEVLVSFEHGDTRRPYVVGGLFNGVDAPPFPDAVDTGSGKVQVRGLRTRAGHELIFTDTEGKERIELRTKDKKVTVVLDATDGGLRIDTEGDVKLTAKGNATLTAKKDLTIDATGAGKITAKRGLTLESSGEVTVRGKMIKLN
ncbi:MAG TPA: VgrG-related protein [Pilimelia sp.]|nr:VgrG-related protein [Pilimelia sp.]